MQILSNAHAASFFPFHDFLRPITVPNNHKLVTYLLQLHAAAIRHLHLQKSRQVALLHLYFRQTSSSELSFKSYYELKRGRKNFLQERKKTNGFISVSAVRSLPLHF